MDSIEQVPYIVYESAQVRSERSHKRLVVALIVAIVLMFASNAFWLYEWTQYDYAGVETTIEQDGEGINNINRGIQGGLINGAEDNNEDSCEEAP